MSYRLIPPGHAVELTTTIEQGLLMPANPLVKLLIEAAMARAQQLHPVTICHYLVEPSHVHLFLVVTNPQDIPGFAERFKTESAHYINSMLGRDKRTVWCESYFCAPILTPSSAREKIAYIYTNPAKDGLEDSIDLYPGLSSWKAYLSGRHKKAVTRVHRSVIPYMPDSSYPEHRYRTEVKRIKRLCPNKQLLVLSPNAWMECFGIAQDRALALNREVLHSIRAKEQRFRELRDGPVIGAKALQAAHLNTEYMPKRDGKKMWCISDNKELRIKYIQWAKDIMEKARRVYERWKQGDFSVSFPPGVFPPRPPMLANLLPSAVG